MSHGFFVPPRKAALALRSGTGSDKISIHHSHGHVLYTWTWTIAKKHQDLGSEGPGPQTLTLAQRLLDEEEMTLDPGLCPCG